MLGLRFSRQQLRRTASLVLFGWLFALLSGVVNAGPILLASDCWPLATAITAAAPWQPLERPASAGPPLFLRLLRLTI